MEIRENRFKRRINDTLRLNITSYLRRFNRVFIVLRFFKRAVQYLIWRSKDAYRWRKHPFQKNRVIWINPQNIALCTVKEFNPIISDGIVLDGDWDISNKLFEDLDIFNSFKDHFTMGASWVETVFYRNTIRSIANGKFYWGCKNEDDFKARCIKLDELYSEIRSRGYKTQREINQGLAWLQLIDEISVNVDRNGQLLFNNGAHRLSIAKILQIEKIPVRITVWHQKCQMLSCVFSVE
jgi:hypothetical protein